jgi:hypothetical protein
MLTRLLLILLLAVVLSPLAGAQPSAAQVERNATELKRGMTLEAMQKLLGRPKRTALGNSDSPASANGQGSLQWTYTFGGEYTPRVLQVVFAAKAPEQWAVESWRWASY